MSCEIALGRQPLPVWCVNRGRRRDQGAVFPGFFVIFSGRRKGSFGS